MVQQITWKSLLKLPQDQRARALALLISPSANRNTGELSTTPRNLFRELFAGPKRESHAKLAVDLLKAQGLLVNRQQPGDHYGKWFLRLPRDLQGKEVDIALLVQLTEVANNLFERFGPERIRDLIVILEQRLRP